METIFKLGIGWIFVSYYLVYLQTRFWGYLLVSLGAFFNLFAYMFLTDARLAVILAVTGKILFFGGIAVTATFGMDLERERLRVSSWSEILRGIVPERLRTKTLNVRDQMMPALIMLGFLAVAFYVGGDKFAAFGFFVLGLAFLVYYRVHFKA